MAVIETMSLLLSKLGSLTVSGFLRAMVCASRSARARIATIRSVSTDTKKVIRWAR